MIAIIARIIDPQEAITSNKAVSRSFSLIIYSSKRLRISTITLSNFVSARSELNSSNNQCLNLPN